jgi:hypothetical protein
MIKQKMWERDNVCTLSGRFIQRFPIITDIPQVGCLLVHVVAALRTYQAFLARFAMVRAFDARSDRAFWS